MVGQRTSVTVRSARRGFFSTVFGSTVLPSFSLPRSDEAGGEGGSVWGVAGMSRAGLRAVSSSFAAYSHSATDELEAPMYVSRVDCVDGAAFGGA